MLLRSYHKVTFTMLLSTYNSHFVLMESSNHTKHKLDQHNVTVGKCTVAMRTNKQQKQ